jgi:DNA-binding transcriptional ArsR family regulator
MIRWASYNDCPMTAIRASATAGGPAINASRRGQDVEVLAGVLHALGDPMRLRIVDQLSDGLERRCGSLSLPIAKSTCSHHFRVLRDAGVISTRVEGKARLNKLEREQLELRFPGLLSAVMGSGAE